MANSSTKSGKGKAPAHKSAKRLAPRAATKPAPATIKKSAKGGGNGNRSSQQAQLELDTSEDTVETPSPGKSASPPPAVPTGTLPPAMRELGLSAKEAWKVDLRGKRVTLDEKGWREELARALGRAPAKA